MLETDLLVGTYGWDRDDWAGGFYPQDLPEDWRLGYYSNRLRALLVPASTWDDTGLDVAEWQDDLYPDFRLVLEWQLPAHGDVVAATEAFIDRHRPVAGNVDAYLLRLAGAVDENVGQAIHLLQSQHPVCVIDADGSPRDDIEGTGVCWLVDHQPQPPSGGSYLVALTGEKNPRTLRDVIEKIDAWSNSEKTGDVVVGAGLFLTGDADGEKAVEARTIAELLGI